MKKKLKHKKVVQEWYEVSFDASQRKLGGEIDKLLKEAPELDNHKQDAQIKWQDNHEVLRDHDGDFDGVLIYNSDDTKPLIMFICDKIGVKYENVKDLNFKLVF